MKTALAFAGVLLLAACGGGGGGGSVLSQPPGGAPAPPPVAAGSGPTMIADTTGRVGLFQEFDRFMSADQIRSDAPHYDAVWGASQAQTWLSAHPGMVLAEYFIPQEDRSVLSGHDLAWWQANHPDWILYACTASGAPTHDLAYWAGVDRADVPLDFHNPAVIDYQVRQLNGAYAVAHGDNALAIDQVIFDDAMAGGNPNFGQSVKSGEFACGIWKGGTFVRRYSGVHDPAWKADMVAFVKTARQLTNLKIVVNHPFGSIGDPAEQELLANIDGMVFERGYGDYGRYNTAADAALFNATTAYVSYIQKHGITAFVINYFKVASVTPAQREYTVAAYFMGNEGGEDLYITPSTGGAEQNYPEYGTQLGKPCGGYYAGPPHIYYRKYSGGLVVVNSGSLPAVSVNAPLPSGHSYSDIDRRPVSNPLSVASNDGYVLLTSNGCS